MTTSRADLPIVIDRARGIPLATQVAAQLRDSVTAGLLTAGDRLPSSRDLAAVLGVSRTVITGAYTQLFAEGWLEGRHGSGTFVAEAVFPRGASPPLRPPSRGLRPPDTPRPGPEPNPLGPGETVLRLGPPTYRATEDPLTPPFPGEPGTTRRDGVSPGLPSYRAGDDFPAPGLGRNESALIDLPAGIPWIAGIEAAAWRRAWRTAGRQRVGEWPEPFGIWELREELASFLRRSRGLAVTPDQILITRGVTSGLGMLTAELVRPGDGVGVEEPGYPRAREVLARAGAVVVPCRVDTHGVVPAELPSGLRLLYTTPAHQYPLGGRLPVGRRQALVEWARSCGAVIVEDDYDSEFRYDVGPLPALFGMGGDGLDQDVIAYLGTASKMLTPSVGVGWLVGPGSLVDRLAASRDGLGERVSEPAQHAIAALLASGDLERHVRRMRLEYARRRAALVDGLGLGVFGLSGFRLLGDTAGMHVVLELPPGTSARDVASAALRRGVSVATLDRYFTGPVTVEGLILGYGATSLPQVRKAAAILREVLVAARDLVGYSACRAGRCPSGWLGREATRGIPCPVRSSWTMATRARSPITCGQATGRGRAG